MAFKPRNMRQRFYDIMIPNLRQKKETETLHLKSGNFLLDFLDAEDLHGEGVTVSVM